MATATNNSASNKPYTPNKQFTKPAAPTASRQSFGGRQQQQQQQGASSNGGGGDDQKSKPTHYAYTLGDKDQESGKREKSLLDGVICYEQESKFGPQANGLKIILTPEALALMSEQQTDRGYVFYVQRPKNG